MALWPFGKNKGAGSRAETPDTPPAEPAADEARRADADATAAVEDAAAAPAAAAPEVAREDAPAGPVVSGHDAVNGQSSPFDGDAVRIEDFDFSDFSQVTLNLSSMRIPLPEESQVQVEMGDTGPKMVHIVTRHGRATPVAFASPRTGGLWEKSSEEIAEGMRAEGMPVSFETGPWGREVVGTGANGTIRIIGVEGPRWLYRLTLAAPEGREDELTSLGREIVARSFVYRGSDPILAGNSLPVVLPQQLAAQVQEAVRQRAAQQAAQQQAQQGQQPTPGNPNTLADALQELMDAPSAQNEDKQ